MVQLSPILIIIASNLWGIRLAFELSKTSSSSSNNNIKLIQRNIIPLSHGAGAPSIPQSPASQILNSQHAIDVAGKPSIPPMAQGFQSHLGQAKSIAPQGFKFPMVVHQGFRPVIKAEAPPAPPPPPPPQATEGDNKPKGDQAAPPPPPPPKDQNNEPPSPPPPSPSGSHNFQNISPSLAPNDYCRNSCKMNEGMTFVYCYQDCTHDPNWLLVPEDVESASLPTNLMQPSENKQTTNNNQNNNNSTGSDQISTTVSSKKPKSTYASDRTQIIFTMDSNSGINSINSLHYSPLIIGTITAIIIF